MHLCVFISSAAVESALELFGRPKAGGAAREGRPPCGNRNALCGMPFIVADDIIIVITVGAPKKVNSCCCARTRLCWRVNKQFELVAAARPNM